MKTVKVVFHFFQSFFYLYHHLIFNKKIDVLFYYPQHFNLPNDKVRTLQIMIDVCRDNNISYLLIEEPDLNFKRIRNKDAVKFDFFYFIISLLRKIYAKTACVYQRDRQIGSLISSLFLGKNKIKNIITVSQSMQSLFSVVYPKANLYDYQHGVISTIYDGFIVDDKIAPTLLDNNVKLFVHGLKVKEKIKNCDGGEYFDKNVFVVGAPFKKHKIAKKSFNGNILFSLQFSNSHSVEQNKLFYDQSLLFFEKIKSDFPKIKIFLKHHPRFSNCIDITSFYNYNFVFDSPLEMNECFQKCSLHITEYSTMVFDGVTFGVPTLFTNFDDQFDLFKQEYEFPYSEINIIDGLAKLSNDNFYINLYNDQLKKTNQFYQAFDESLFLKSILK